MWLIQEGLPSREAMPRYKVPSPLRKKEGVKDPVKGAFFKDVATPLFLWVCGGSISKSEFMKFTLSLAY